MSSAIFCSLFPLISRIHSSLFSDWRRTILSKFFDTQLSSISTEKLVLFHRCFNRHSLLLSSYLSGIGRIENPSCNTCGHCPRTPLNSFCTFQLWTLSAARSLATLCLSTTSGSGPGESPGFWCSMVFRHAPFLGRGRVSTTSNKNRINKRPICPSPCIMWIVINLKFCLNIL